jgi:cytochrome c-type biogenesis protein CcmH/NrfG
MDGRSRISKPRDRADLEPAPTGLLVSATDAGLAAAIFLLPFIMGGRQAWGHLLVGLIACWTALAWSIHQILAERPRWRWSGAEPLFVMGIAILILQVISLPESTLLQVSPKLAERLPLWGPESEFGRWTTVSLTPEDTFSNLLTVASCMLLFVVAVQRLQNSDDVTKLLTAIGLSTAAMATFGILQLAVGNGSFFWFYDHPYTDAARVAKGAFTNANHFSHFIALGIPIWLWKFASQKSPAGSHESEWRSSRGSGSRGRFDSILALGCLGVIGGAILLSQSRGGVLVGAGGASLTLLLLWRQNLVSAGMVMLVCVAGALCGASLLLFGDRVEAMVERSLLDIDVTDINKLDKGQARRKIWTAAVAATKDFPILGTGLGSHVEVYPTYYDAPNTGIEYTHAENGYLQVAMETGITGIAIAAMFILLVGYWCARGLRSGRTSGLAAPLAAISAALVMNLVHSITDFIWYVPSCMVLALLFAAAAVRLSQLTAPAVPLAPTGARLLVRTAWGAVAAGMLGFGTLAARVEWPAVVAEPHWFDYIRLTRALRVDGKDDDQSTDFGLVKRRLSSALAAARANPRAHRPQLAAARAYRQYVEVKLEQSENAMPLTQLREAARSNFESLEDMQAWLEKPAVLGDRRKLLAASVSAARRSLRLCPLSPRGYLILADLGWLNGQDAEYEHDLLAQAFAIRPFDARVHFMLGREEFLAQRPDEALAHWRESFNRDNEYRRQLIAQLSRILPASFFLANFDVDLDSLSLLREAYRESPDQKGYRNILGKLAIEDCRAAKSAVGDEAANHWTAACTCFIELEDDRKAVAAAEAAVKANPASFIARKTLGNLLFDQGDYAGAAKHLSWCVSRQPDDDSLRARKEQALAELTNDGTRVAEERNTQDFR